MRVCRIRRGEAPQLAYYFDDGVAPLADILDRFLADGRPPLESLHQQDLRGDELLHLLPHGRSAAAAQQLHQWCLANAAQRGQCMLPLETVQLLKPIPRPPKLLLLAGNYAAHIEEGGEIAAERQQTFPYVFMKPPTTTLNDPQQPVRIPVISPQAIDWELELAVVIGRLAKAVPAAEALDYVAGYTVINDISNRKFRPNPQRIERPRDRFFDWLHGKWHDSFCPCGPCVAAASAIPDPQTLQMTLRVNGQVKQSASTAQQIFPVAEVIAFISNLMTLEPGDLISTGTAAGVGNTRGDYLQPGDVIDAEIQSIGKLQSPVVAE